MNEKRDLPNATHETSHVNPATVTKLGRRMGNGCDGPIVRNGSTLRCSLLLAILRQQQTGREQKGAGEKTSQVHSSSRIYDPE